jgi:hypothetical protein
VEGTRSPDGRLLPFKKGPFYLAMQTGAPCIPVSIYGTETMMAKGSVRIQPGTAHIVFHAPIDPAILRPARSCCRRCARPLPRGCRSGCGGEGGNGPRNLIAALE